MSTRMTRRSAAGATPPAPADRKTTAAAGKGKATTKATSAAQVVTKEKEKPAESPTRTTKSQEAAATVSTKSKSAGRPEAKGQPEVVSPSRATRSNRTAPGSATVVEKAEPEKPVSGTRGSRTKAKEPEKERKKEIFVPELEVEEEEEEEEEEETQPTATVQVIETEESVEVEELLQVVDDSPKPANKTPAPPVKPPPVVPRHATRGAVAAQQKRIVGKRTTKTEPTPISVESLTGEEEDVEVEVDTPQQEPTSRAAKRKSSALPPSQPDPPHPLEQETEEQLAQQAIAMAHTAQRRMEEEYQQAPPDTDYAQPAGSAPDDEFEEDGSPPAKFSKRQNSALIYQQQESKQSGGVTSLTTRVVVEAPQLPMELPYVENPLPGVADEVESYPCKFCPERVFLTSFGLERHTKMAHPDRLEEILQDITRIQEEWKRREHEREKQRERMALSKIRQEALAAAAAREAFQARSSMPGDVEPDVVDASHRRTWGRPNPTAVNPGQYYNDGAMAGHSNFESCRICGLLINAEHPTAMENHMRAHKKNDELRAHLINTYGPEFVARVTCHECQLVFTDERKLISHAEAMHVRRRKYVCKWCGHVCLTMTDLNNHKADVHGMPVNRSRDPEARKNRQLAALTKGRGIPPPLGMQSASSRRAQAIAEAARTQNSNRVLTSVEELPCRTTCDICHLVMVKPSLLIRHMMRVHNRTNFTATVETKGMPSFKITVDQGKLSWACCGEEYTDRSAFVFHRRMNHQPKLTPPGGSIGSRTMYFDTDSMQNQLAASGGSGNEYVLLLMNEDEAAQAGSSGAENSSAVGMASESNTEEPQSSSVSAANGAQAEGQGVTVQGQDSQQIVLTPEQLQELGISAEDAENLVLLVDDGSGNITGTDGNQVQLDPETLASLTGGQQMVVLGEGDEFEGGAIQVMVGDDGQLQLVQGEAAKPIPISGEMKHGIVVTATGGTNTTQTDATTSYQEYLNTEATQHN